MQQPPGQPISGHRLTALYKNMMPSRWYLWVLTAFSASGLLLSGENRRLKDTDFLRLADPGDYQLRILSSNLLELTLITTKAPDPAPVTEWNFVTPTGTLNLPPASQFEVTIDGRGVGVDPISFKRRPRYAPLKQRDLRIGNHLYLQLAEPIADGAAVQVLNPSQNLIPSGKQFVAVKDPFRWSPAIHVNHAGYSPELPKKATVGLYLGNAGELPVSMELEFRIVETAGSNVVFQSTLTSRPDSGYTYSPVPYQAVLEADFSAYTVPGEYWLQVPDLGVSFPFRIQDGAMASIARTYALGLYHQRCGTGNSAPFTRHTHGPCHLEAAEVPTTSFTEANQFLAQQTADYANEPRHTAPQMTNVNASLYPFINTNNIDVSGGHHDAGDYSKYTVDSAQFIHALTFAVDTIPTVRALDNLGLPESGDGISDVLQIAKLEADFLAKMQDADGGFYFLVYPRDRQYEHDVLPDQGDRQIVYPKTTTSTAAAVAALAQIASSPAFQAHFPAEAAVYLQKARDGWSFLDQAIATHGRDGAYQKITHYGATFIHDDELAWAATELFLATGESQFHNALLAHFDPSASTNRLWTWWRLYEGYGCAVRSYAFSGRSGRQPETSLDSAFLEKCRQEILLAAEDQLSYSRSNAYGVSFPIPSKEFRVAGWFFPINQAFDLLAGFQLDPKPEYLDAIVANINYELGTNPENVSFLTGLGWKRQREIVHQYAQNDRRLLPPSGFPLGAIQSGFPYLEPYKSELGSLTFPSDGDTTSAYAPYDRWSDCFNVTTEFVSAQQARALAIAAFVWADFSPNNQPWQSGNGTITGAPAETEMNEELTVRFEAPGMDLSGAIIVWEAKEQEPFIGPEFTFAPTNVGPCWVEAEVILPDGRRLFDEASFNVRFATELPPNSYQSNALLVVPELTALYHLDFTTEEETGKQLPLELLGNTRFEATNLGWMAERNGGALRFDSIGDFAMVEIANSTLYDAGTEAIVLELMLYVGSFLSPDSNIPLATLSRNWNASLELLQNRYFGPTLRGGTEFEISGPGVSDTLRRNRWNHLRLAIGKTGYSVRINGELLDFTRSSELNNWNAPSGTTTLTVGNFEGWVDEIAVWNVKTNHSLELSASLTNANELNVSVSANPGIHFILESSTNLVHWTSVSTNLLLTPTKFLITMDAEIKFLKATPIP